MQIFLRILPLYTFGPNVRTTDWLKISPEPHFPSSSHVISTSFILLHSGALDVFLFSPEFNIAVLDGVFLDFLLCLLIFIYINFI